MLSRAAKQGLVWGGFLILVGVLSLVGVFTDLSSWVWAVCLAAGGLGALILYLTDRSDWAILIPTYALWAAAGLAALVALDVLHDEAIAVYVLVAIALPFLAVFVRDRPKWWALIPAYVLLAEGLFVGLIGLGVLDDLLVAAYVLFAIAIPFFVVYARDRRQWWALIPGGILAFVGLSFLFVEAAFEYIAAPVLILVGAWLLVRVFARREPPDVVDRPEADAPESSGPETDGQERLHEE
jgi:hypothetical protein